MIIVPKPYTYLGLELMFVGLAIATWAAMTFRKAGTSYQASWKVVCPGDRRALPVQPQSDVFGHGDLAHWFGRALGVVDPMSVSNFPFLAGEFLDHFG